MDAMLSRRYVISTAVFSRYGFLDDMISRKLDSFKKSYIT